MNILGKEYPKVGRINRRVLIVVAVIICLLFFFAFLSGIGKQDAKKKATQEAKTSTSSYNDWIPEHISYADTLKEKELPGSIQKKSNNKEINELRREIQNLKKALAESQNERSHADLAREHFNNAQKEPAKRRPPERKSRGDSKDLKYQQKAYASDIFFFKNTGKLSVSSMASAATATPEERIAQAQQRFAQMQNNLPVGVNAASPSVASLPDLGELGIPGFGGGTDELVAQNNQKGKVEFMNDTVEPDKVYNKDQLHKPLSPYELKAGSVIPLSLITGLNSDLPGKISAQVRETIYDSVTGNHVLIPQGSKMIGEYDSIITYGQERILLVFKRILLPNGNSISLEKFQGIDLQGYSGLSDSVDNHWWRILGSVVISSALTAMAEMTDDVDKLDSKDGTIIANSVSQEIAETASKIIRRQINIQPTLKVRPGWNFNVFVEKDIILEPYRG